MAEDAFEAVVSAHHAEIRRYLLRITGRGSDADDLSQETFLRAFRAYRALPPGANVRAWLFAIATNLGRNHFRAQGRRRRAYAAAAFEMTAGAPDRADGRVLADEARARMERVITGLPAKQRLAFIMRKMHELDYTEIGASLSCSEESARAHVFQALRKVRRGLEGHFPVGMESRS
ncbi:MAG: RNA polymerase sigma factor [Candidatus Rokuibacteriota bacterium]